VTEPSCEKLLLAQADFDGELAAADAAALAGHRAQCAVCQEAYGAMAQVREVVRAPGLYADAPDSLRRFLAQKSATAGPERVARGPLSWWRRPIAGFGVSAVLAAALVLLVVQPRSPDMIDRVVDDHVRALQPGHLWDVESTDRHTVKPWFEGRLDFAPPVKDLAPQQYPLVGGRLDALDGRTIAALVYKHGAHPIDLLVWPTPGSRDAAPTVVTRQGFTIIHWSAQGMAYWAVADTDRAPLEEFVRLWRAAP
jgi:anti-sigma factor RsiW